MATYFLHLFTHICTLRFKEAETLASSHLTKGPKAAQNPHGKKNLALGYTLSSFSVNLISSESSISKAFMYSLSATCQVM